MKRDKIILVILILSMITLILSSCDGWDSVIPTIPDDVPVIESITPNFGPPGTEVTIKGRNFGEINYLLTNPYLYYNVTFGNSLVIGMSWSDTQIIVEAPSDYGTGIQNASMAAAILEFFVTGKITKLLGPLLPELVELELDVGSEAWWESWYKIAAAIGLPFVGVRPKEAEMDIIVTVETPAGSDGGLFTYVVPPNEVTYLEEEVTLDSFRVAFEDVEWANWSGGDCQGNNDYDYEDCVCDVDVDGKFICGDHLKEVKFTITYQNDGSGNLDHEFGLKMPSIFVGKSCTYNLNGSIFSGVPCPGEFVFFHKDTATPGEVFYLTITFESLFLYSYSGFIQTDIHGNLIDIKPFINIYWDSDNSFKEKLLAGTGDKRVLLVPDGWQWTSSDSTPLWDVYAEVIETDCYPEFTNPGTWTWTGGTSIPVSIIMEEFNGNTIGNSYGIVYTNTINGQGAVFSRVKESRIEYPFSIGFPHEGTIEYLIKIYSGYRYSDYFLNDNSDCARIFDTGSQDVWYPGAIWIDVCNDGTINLGTATTYAQPECHNLKATGTDFTFNEWHTIGISFGSQGQYIMLDGNIVASNASYTESLQTCGNFTSAVNVPTIGELVSCFWVNNRHDAGFEGVIDRFRVSEKQEDWYLSKTSPSQ